MEKVHLRWSDKILMFILDFWMHLSFSIYKPHGSTCFSLPPDLLILFRPTKTTNFHLLNSIRHIGLGQLQGETLRQDRWVKHPGLPF